MTPSWEGQIARSFPVNVVAWSSANEGDAPGCSVSELAEPFVLTEVMPDVSETDRVHCRSGPEYDNGGRS